jgi:hypothetical protein
VPHHQDRLFGSRYSEISTVPTLLNKLGAMSFGTIWLSGGNGRSVSAQREIGAHARAHRFRASPPYARRS